MAALLAASDERYGPMRAVVKIIETRGPGRARVQLECAHTRTWKVGPAKRARCFYCRTAAPRRRPVVAAVKPPKVRAVRAVTTAPVTASAIDLTLYEKLIQQQAWKCLRMMPPRNGYTHEDLVQEGWEVAVRAAACYRPNGGSKFITYLHTSLGHRLGRVLKKEWSIASECVAVDVDEPAVLDRLGMMGGQPAVDVLCDLTTPSLPVATS